MPTASQANASVKEHKKAKQLPGTNPTALGAFALLNNNDGSVTQYVNTGGALVRKRVYENFVSSSLYEVTVQAASGAGYGAPDGIAGVINHIQTPGKNIFAWCPFVGQALFPTLVANAGLDITCDLTDNDGCEIITHHNGASGASPFIAGVDPAFYFKCKLNVATVAGTDDLHVGFRKAEKFNATFDNYLDLASIGIVGASGDIKIETIKDNAATVTTDTTDNWTDGQSKTLEVYVSSAGVVTYKIDGVAPTVPAAYTFDARTPVVPFVHFLHTASPDDIIIESWDVGFQT